MYNYEKLEVRKLKIVEVEPGLYKFDQWYVEIADKTWCYIEGLIKNNPMKVAEIYEVMRNDEYVREHNIKYGLNTIRAYLHVMRHIGWVSRTRDGWVHSVVDCPVYGAMIRFECPGRNCEEDVKCELKEVI